MGRQLFLSSKRENSMHTLPSLTGHHLSPQDLAVVRRVFEATCLKTRIQERGIQADRLARFIMDEFRFGNTDEGSLLECALRAAAGV